jgi:hypothetical protein
VTTRSRPGTKAMSWPPEPGMERAAARDLYPAGTGPARAAATRDR